MEPPPYNPNVPQNPSDSLATSQPQLLNNFLQIYQSFIVNHVPLDAASGAGNHTIIQLLEQAIPFQTGVSEIAVYSKEVKGQTDQIFLRYQGNGQEIQLTNYQIYSPGPNQYFTFLPGKILLYFGSFTTLTGNNLNLVPPVATKIITMDFCPSASTPTIKPKVVLQQPSNGFYTTINVTSSIFINQAAPPCYYLVMANL